MRKDEALNNLNELAQRGALHLVDAFSLLEGLRVATNDFALGDRVKIRFPEGVERSPQETVAWWVGARPNVEERDRAMRSASNRMLAQLDGLYGDRHGFDDSAAASFYGLACTVEDWLDANTFAQRSAEGETYYSPLLEAALLDEEVAEDVGRMMLNQDFINGIPDNLVSNYDTMLNEMYVLNPWLEAEPEWHLRAARCTGAFLADAAKVMPLHEDEAGCAMQDALNELTCPHVDREVIMEVMAERLGAMPADEIDMGFSP